MDWVMATMGTFTTWVREYLPDSAADAKTFEPVAALGTAMGAIFDGLQAALDFSHGFWFTTPNTTLWDDFKTWVRGVFTDFYDWVLATYPQTVEDAVGTFAPVVAFSNALQAVVGGLNQALEFFGNLADVDPAIYTPGTGLSDFRDRIEALMSGIDVTLEAFEVWVMGNYGGAARTGIWQVTVDTFATAISDVFGVMKQALDIFENLNSQNLPSLSEITDFVTAVLHLFGTFTEQLGLVPGEVDAATAGIGDRLAAGLGYDSDLYNTADNWGWDIGTRITGGLRGYVDTKAGTALIAAIGNANSPTGLYLGVRDLLTGNSIVEMVTGGGRQLGSYVVSGMAAGITGMLSGSAAGILHDAIVDLVDYIEEQVQAELGAHSPSQRMRDLVLSTVPTGIAQGLLAGVGQVQAAAAVLAGAMMPAFAGPALALQPAAVSPLAITQTQRQELTIHVGGELSIGGNRVSAQQTEDIAGEIIRQLRLNR